MSSFKIFCDESNHLENDSSDLMLLGAIHCPEEIIKKINISIKKLRYKYSYTKEIKWTKLSINQIDFYNELIELFFQTPSLRFKGTLVLKKHRLNHQAYSSSHDEFYYKMYYYTLKDFLVSKSSYKIYMDFKDTHGGKRVKKLSEILLKKHRGNLTSDFTIIHSHESQIMQMCDLLVGAISYKNRNDIPHLSKIKNLIINKLETLSGIDLKDNTPPWEQKFNIFRFVPRS